MAASAHVQVELLYSILSDCDSFQMQWGNTTDVPLKGWVEMIVQVEEIPKIKVPFLVTSNKLRQPIVEFKAIKVLTQLVSNTEALRKLFQTSFQPSSARQLENMVNLIQKTDKMNEQL